MISNIKDNYVSTTHEKKRSLTSTVCWTENNKVIEIGEKKKYNSWDRKQIQLSHLFFILVNDIAKYDYTYMIALKYI